MTTQILIIILVILTVILGYLGYFFGGLLYHSAWLSPENKLVCVTGSQEHKKLIGSFDDYNYFCLLDNDFQEESRYYDAQWVKRDWADGSWVQTKKVSGDFDNLEMETQDCPLSHYKELFHYGDAVKPYLDKGVPLTHLKMHMRKLHNADSLDAFSKKSILTKRSFNDISKDDKHSRFRDDYETCVYTNRKQKRKVYKPRDKQTFRFV